MQALLDWMANPASTSMTLTSREVLVVGMIVAFFVGARVQLAWSRFVAGFRSTYTSGTFSASFAKAFLEAQTRRQAKSSDIASCAPSVSPAPPANVTDFASATSKTPHRGFGGVSGS